MSPRKKPTPSTSSTDTLRCSGCRHLRDFAQGEGNYAHCDNCGEDMHFQIIDQDVILTLNRLDLMFLSKILYTGYCEHGISDAVEGDHIWAHRLMLDFEKVNPSDTPLAGFGSKSSIMDLLAHVFDASSVKIVFLDGE